MTVRHIHVWRQCLAALVLAGLLAGPGAGTGAAADVVAVAARDGRFDTFVKALDTAGITDVLHGDGPMTVFAPTDEAFRRLPAAMRQALLDLAHAAELKAILGLHVVPGHAYEQNNIPVQLHPMSGGRLVATYTDGALTVRLAPADAVMDPSAVVKRREQTEARVLPVELRADNGIVQAIDTVLLPSDFEELGPAEQIVDIGAQPSRGSAGTAPAGALPVQRDVGVAQTGSSKDGPLTGDDDAATVGREASERSEAGGQMAKAPGRFGNASPVVDPSTPSTLDETPARKIVGEGGPGEHLAVIERTKPQTQTGRTEPESNVTDKGREEALSVSPDKLSVKELLGRKVKARNGEEIGEVGDLLVSLTTARIETFIVDVDAGFLGLLDEPLAVLPDEISIDPLDDSIRIDRSAKAIENQAGGD
ncbi:fasciclin domain-containing protein [Consotaella salsifontis]|nr:fasciclin domain-containing protein [Consotaella salsifontis]